MRLGWKFWISAIIGGLAVGCGARRQPVEDSMQSLISALEQRTKVVRLGDESGGFAIVVPQLGAKVLGVSLNGIAGENLLWVNHAMQQDAFWDVNGKPDWNDGGWRTWLAPEKYFYLDQQKNWFVPSAMDPGDYQSVSGPDHAVTFENRFTVPDAEGHSYALAIRRSIRALGEPKGGLPGGLSGPVKAFGLETTHFLRNEGDAMYGASDHHYVGLWSLLQVRAAGTCIIPINERGSLPAYRDYGPTNFDPIPPDRIHVDERYISWKFDGHRRGKLGIHPKVARPCIAYLRTSVDPPILMIKQFDVDPDGMYVDSPWDRESDYGDAVESYNDDGQMGGFSEIECHGPTRPLAKGEEIWHTVTLNVYQGNLEDLKRIGRHILGIDMDTVHMF